MTTNKPQPATVDEYIATWPADVQTRMQAIRQAMRDAAPQATEALKYAVPTFVYMDKNLISFGGAKNHIGIYPTPSATEAFAEKIGRYRSGRGSVQLPLDEPVPTDLIRELTAFRAAEVEAAAARKAKPKKAA